MLKFLRLPLVILALTIAGPVLAGDAIGASGELCRFVAAPQLVEAIVEGHDRGTSAGGV